MRKIWILSAMHWIFGTIFLSTGIFEIFKINTLGISGLGIDAWLKLIIGVSIISLGLLFAKNIFRPSRNSFFNLN